MFGFAFTKSIGQLKIHDTNLYIYIYLRDFILFYHFYNCDDLAKWTFTWDGWGLWLWPRPWRWSCRCWRRCWQVLEEKMRCRLAKCVFCDDLRQNNLQSVLVVGNKSRYYRRRKKPAAIPIFSKFNLSPTSPHSSLLAYLFYSLRGLFYSLQRSTEREKNSWLRDSPAREIMSNLLLNPWDKWVWMRKRSCHPVPVQLKSYR